MAQDYRRWDLSRCKEVGAHGDIRKPGEQPLVERDEWHPLADCQFDEQRVIGGDIGVQGARKGDTDPEWHDWGPGRNWETATARELVSVIDRRYRTIASRKARALIGISAGGYGAALIAIHHPSVYSVIESWSGYFHPTNPAGTAPMDMGSKEANDWANAHALVSKLSRIFARYPLTNYRFYVGTDDKRFLGDNRKFDKELTAARVRHYYAEYAGGHSQSFWKEHEEDWVTAALRKLERPH